jgi:NAD(P)-dependent dehydrogenase (short-subunit alcohol dehydrogenase family)
MSKVSLEGQVAVVTGAARGVGELLARKLSARGASIALVGLEPDLLKQVGERLHGDSDHWHADVTDHEAMARVAREVKERFGKVDIVVANAGVATGGPFVDSDPDSWRRVIEVNLIGSAVTGRAFLPVLMESRGYLLQIASLAAITPAPMMTAYCASKSGVEAYAHSLRGSGWATCPGRTPTWCAAPTRRTSCGSCGSGCPGRPTRRIRSVRRWTGSWPASSGGRATCTGSGGCAGCRACAATCRGSSGRWGNGR